MSNDKLREALEDFEGKLEGWAAAYPLTIFHEPSGEELKNAHEALKTVGLTLDVLSASAMRYVATSLAAHFLPVRQALAASKPEPVGMNGLTAAEESATASVLGIVNSKPEPQDNRTHVDSGALTMALNVLRRAGKNEVADALEETAVRGKPEPQAQAGEPDFSDLRKKAEVAKNFRIANMENYSEQVVAFMKVRMDFQSAATPESIIEILDALQSHREAMAKETEAAANAIRRLSDDLFQREEAIAKKDAALKACVDTKEKVKAAYYDAMDKYGTSNVLTTDLREVLAAITQAEEAMK